MTFQPLFPKMRVRISLEQCLHVLMVALFIILVLSPLAGLCLDLLYDFLSGTLDLSVLTFFSPRRLWLLFASIGLAATVAGSGILVGVLVVSLLWRIAKKGLVIVLLTVLALAAIPPYIHALTWSSLLGYLTGFLPGLTMTGWGISYWVELMALIPLATLLVWIAFASVDPALVEAGRVFRPDMDAFLHIHLPLAAPALGASFGFLFLLCCSDYSIPSLFGADVYALEIFAQFSASGSSALAFLYALPLMVVMIAVIIASRSGIRTLAQTPDWLSDRKGTAPLFPWPFILLQVLACGVVLFQILVLVSGLLLTTGTMSTLTRSVEMAQGELVYSLLVAAGVVIVSLPLALAAAHELKQPGLRGGISWGLVLLPLAMPASLTGIGLILFWNTPGMAVIYPDLLMPVLAGVARFAPFAAIILFVQLRFIDPVLFDAAAVFSRSLLKTWVRVRLPLYVPGLLVAAGILAALTLAELGATLVVAPPGYGTITLRIYNYLHYGSAGEVAGLCLMITILCLIVGVCTVVAVTWLYRDGREKRPEGDPVHDRS
jgi:iron(III) transport system permease protein